MSDGQVQKISKRKLYPDGLYDVLFKAGLIGEGVVIIKGYFSKVKAERKGDDGVWRDKEVLAYDTTSSKYQSRFVPVVDRNGRVLGDWTTGLTVEEIKRVHEEARVPKYTEDSVIGVSHDMVLELSDPIQKSMFEILKHNSGIAHSLNDRLDDQDFYFFKPSDEFKAKKEVLEKKKEAYKLIQDLAYEAKNDILTILEFEEGIAVSASATTEDKLLLFEEVCFEIPEKVYNVSQYQNKKKRIMLYTLLSHALIISPNGFGVGPYYRVSNSSEEFGATVGETTEEAIAALGKAENSDLVRAYQQIISHGRIQDTAMSNETIEKVSSILDEITEAEYELPEKVTKTFLNNAPKAAHHAFLKQYGKEHSMTFDEKDTNAILLEKSLKLLELLVKDDKK